MQIDATHNLGKAAARQGAPAASAAAGTPHFSDLINPRDFAGDRTPASPRQRVHQAAVQLVSSTLVKPILDQVRKDPLRSELFHGGSAEDAFGAQLDTILADRVTAGANLPVVGAVERSILRSPAAAAAAPGARLDARA
jgi:hypothetical protein